MKKFGVSVLLGLFALSVFVGSVSARPQYKKVSDERYKDSPIAEAAADAKCNLCHFGKSKKNRNDFGKALSKYLNKDVYTELKSDADKLNEAVTKALEKVEGEKNPEGEAYGDRIKAGKLPGSVEEEEAE